MYLRITREQTRAGETENEKKKKRKKGTIQDRSERRVCVTKWVFKGRKGEIYRFHDTNERRIHSGRDAVTDIEEIGSKVNPNRKKELHKREFQKKNYGNDK